MAEWITADDVADYLSGTVEPTEERVVLSTAAVRAAVERRRADLAFADDASTPADVRLGAIMWAGLLVQQRSAPGGFEGYDAETALMDAGSKRAEIHRLLGWRRAVVA